MDDAEPPQQLLKRRRFHRSSPELSMPENPQEEYEEEDVLLREILEALDTIKRATEKTEETDVAVVDQHQLTDARETIYRNIILLNSRTKRIELQNMKLKMELKQCSATHEQTTQRRPEPQRQLLRRLQQQKQQPAQAPLNQPSYAQIVTEKTYGKLPQRNALDNTEKETWKTPEKEKNKDSDLFLHTKDGADAMKFWRQTAGTTIKASDIGGAVKNIVKLRRDRIIIQTTGDEQKTKIKALLAPVEGVDVKDDNKINPTIQICGVQADLTEDELKQMMRDENDYIADKFTTEEVRRGLRILTKRKCRNPSKENWLIETKPTLAKLILKTGKVNLNLTRHFVEEVVGVAQCFKCCGFNHVKKFCDQTTETCHKCGGNHEARSCNSSLDCVNCKRMRISDRKHSARDKQCPCYVRKIEMARKSVDYSEETTKTTEDNAQNDITPMEEEIIPKN